MIMIRPHTALCFPAARPCRALAALVALAALMSLVCSILTAPLPAAAAPQKTPLSQQEAESRLAAMLAEQAQFIAELEPILAEAGFEASPFLPPWQRQAHQAAEILWRLSPLPDRLQAEKAALLEGSVPPAQRMQALEQRIKFYDDIARQMITFMISENPQAYRRYRDRPKGLAGSMAVQEILEPYFLFVAANGEAVEAIQHALGNKEGLTLLWAMKDAPEARNLTMEILRVSDLSPVRKRALIELALQDIEAARERLADLPRLLALEQGYDDILSSADDAVAFSVSSLLPQAAERFAELKKIPLATKPMSKPAASLTVTKREKLFSGRELEAMEELEAKAFSIGALGKMGLQLSLLRPGETLYALSWGTRPQGGIPLFTGTPLAEIAEGGPFLMPFTKENNWIFLAAGNFHEPILLLASPAGPQEVAAHLGSLGVVYSDRGIYLFDISKTPQTSREDIVDTPGPRPRLTNVAYPGFLPELLLMADAKGAARLMGPITALWRPLGPWGRPQNGTNGWQEIRHAPRADAKGLALGEAPLLSLSPHDLEQLLKNGEAVIREGLADALLEYNDLSKEESRARADAAMAIARGLGYRRPERLSIVAFSLARLADSPQDMATLGAILLNGSLAPDERYLRFSQESYMLQEKRNEALRQEQREHKGSRPQE